MERHLKGRTMPPRADHATLNVQPRQRRDVYEGLAKLSEGRSVKDLLDDFEMPERELRETLRKLDEAGLARRMKGTWWAVPLEAEPLPIS
jgi:DNA-binding transcriptional ArsR family regulator